MKIMNVKGGYDYLPQEQNLRNYINNILRETFEEYGYKSVETPILTFYDILADKYDANNDILKEIYKLSDQGERKLGLRYDLTVPFAKLIALNKNKIKFPFKRYEINKVFRDGPIKLGRDREFTQCDVDVVGLEGQLIEVELLSLYQSAFKKLGIDIIIKYNSRNLMNGLIIESGISYELLSNVTTIIDKMDKITECEFKNYLLELGLERKQIDKLNKYLNLSLDEINDLFKDTSNEILKQGLAEIQQLTDYINDLNLNDICVFSPTLARGQNYYTGNIFEVYDKEKRITSSIGGGGRYDKMVTDFIGDGNQYPAVGISFGLSSIYEILKNQNLINDEANIYIIPIDTQIESLKLANNLRNMGLKVEVEMQNKKMKKSLEYADKEKIRYVIIYGDTELKNKCFSLKDMYDGTQYAITDIKEIKKIVN